MARSMGYVVPASAPEPRGERFILSAASSGKVRIKKYERAGYGKYLVIRHNNGLETIYGHMSDWLVEENQVVKAGQPIGLGGNTGRSTGSHLHFETRLCGVALNPALLFDFVNQDVTADYYMFRKETFEHESVAINKNLLLEGGRSNELAKETDNNNGRNRNVREFSETKYHKVSVGETLTRIIKFFFSSHNNFFNIISNVEKS